MLEARDSAHTIKMIAMLLNVVHRQVHKNIYITKKSDELHNHFTVKTTIGQAIPPFFS